ncbi:MAG: cysteine synthase A [Bacteroidales bacterium]|jgi:cysteine synthase A|nr:cysteine synthase A [Bacteroidales bacterium]
MKYNNVLETIGNTPHIRLSKLFPGHEVWVKDERRNPGGSIKDRIALAMIEDAENSGKLKSGGVIVEPTSGNTGIGLAMAGAVRGYKVILVMPDSMTIERRKILKALGAELILTPKESGMSGAVKKAAEIADKTPGSWIPMQFENPSNPAVHSRTTALEIIADFPEGLDYFVAGVGTGGHLTGVGRILKERYPEIKIIAVEPSASPVLSGGDPGPHPIQGIGAGFVPRNYYPGIADRIISVNGSSAFEMVRSVSLIEGLLAGISTGASLAAIFSLQNEIPGGSRILLIAYDTGERYLSIPDLWD